MAKNTSSLLKDIIEAITLSQPEKSDDPRFLRALKRIEKTRNTVRQTVSDVDDNIANGLYFKRILNGAMIKIGEMRREKIKSTEVKAAPDTKKEATPADVKNAEAREQADNEKIKLATEQKDNTEEVVKEQKETNKKNDVLHEDLQDIRKILGWIHQALESCNTCGSGSGLLDDFGIDPDGKKRNKKGKGGRFSRILSGARDVVSRTISSAGDIIRRTGGTVAQKTGDIFSRVGSKAGTLARSAGSVMSNTSPYIARAGSAIGGVSARAGGALASAAPAAARFLGPIAASGATGWTLGGIINEKFIEGTKAGDMIGEGIAKAMAFLGNDEAKAAVESNKKYESNTDMLMQRADDENKQKRESQEKPNNQLMKAITPWDNDKDRKDSQDRDKENNEFLSEISDSLKTLIGKGLNAIIPAAEASEILPPPGVSVATGMSPGSSTGAKRAGDISARGSYGAASKSSGASSVAAESIDKSNEIPDEVKQLRVKQADGSTKTLGELGVKTYADVQTKGGQAFSGGHNDAATLYTTAILQKELGDKFTRVTAQNDEYHHKYAPSSEHTKGYKTDFTLNGMSYEDGHKEISAKLEKYGLTEGKDFNIISQKHGTGEHIDFRLTGSGQTKMTEYAKTQNTNLATTKNQSFTKNGPAPDNFIDWVGKVDSGKSGDAALSVVYGQKNHGMDLTKMTVNEVIAQQQIWKKDNISRGLASSAAAGKFQAMDYTLRDAIASGAISGDDKFDATTQNKFGEWAALNKAGRAPVRKFVEDKEKYQRGEISQADYEKSRAAAAASLSEEWSSMPDPRLGGKSHYGKDGHNKALVSQSEMYAAMDSLPFSSAQASKEQDAAGVLAEAESMKKQDDNNKSETSTTVERTAANQQSPVQTKNKVNMALNNNSTSNTQYSPLTARNDETVIARLTDRFFSNGVI